MPGATTSAEVSGRQEPWVVLCLLFVILRNDHCGFLRLTETHTINLKKIGSHCRNQFGFSGFGGVVSLTRRGALKSLNT